MNEQENSQLMSNTEIFKERLPGLVTYLNGKYNKRSDDEIASVLDFNSPVRRSPRIAQHRKHGDPPEIDDNPILAIERQHQVKKKTCKTPQPNERSNSVKNSTSKAIARTSSQKKIICQLDPLAPVDDKTITVARERKLQEEALKFFYENVMDGSSVHYSSLLINLLRDKMRELLGEQQFLLYLNDAVPETIRITPLIRTDEKFRPEIDLIVELTACKKLSLCDCINGVSETSLQLSSQIMRRLCIQNNDEVSLCLNQRMQTLSRAHGKQCNLSLQKDYVSIIYDVISQRSLLSSFLLDILRKQFSTMLGSERYGQFCNRTMPSNVRIIGMIRVNESNSPEMSLMIKAASSSLSPFEQIKGMNPVMLQQTMRILSAIVEGDTSHLESRPWSEIVAIRR